jgi:MtN3 and saliva related transmembrane protein
VRPYNRIVNPAAAWNARNRCRDLCELTGRGLACTSWKPAGGAGRCSASLEAALMAILDYTGYAAAICTTGAYVPQVLRVWRTKSTKDISLKTFAALVTGLSLWLVYGIWRGEIPLIAANGVTLMLASTILYFKIRHG